MAPAIAFQLFTRNAKSPTNSTLRKKGAIGASPFSAHIAPASVTENFACREKALSTLSKSAMRRSASAILATDGRMAAVTMNTPPIQ